MRALGPLDRGVAWVIAAVMAVMVAVVSIQVAYRYGLNGSFDWADEISRLAFVWTVFLAVPLGLKQGAHIGIELVVQRLPENARGALYRLMSALAVVLMLTVAWQAAVLVTQQWDEMLPTIPLSSALFMVPVAWSAVHSAVHLAVLAGTGRVPRPSAASGE
ncbi:MAG: TRAP transporter small permease [Betaproteobacteria bacterium]|nr:MAG: TRAP transporter small permease [Betaproteobacteria bacterium]